MRKVFIWLFGLLALYHALIVTALEWGAPGMRTRVRIACRHATLYDTSTSEVHASIPKLYLTRQDLEQCSDKVQKQYAELVDDAYRLTDPEDHRLMWQSLAICVCLLSAVVMLLSADRRSRTPPKIEQ